MTKLTEKDVELATLRAMRKADADEASDSSQQLGTLIRERDEAISAREADAKSRDDEIKKALKEKDDSFKVLLKEKDDEMKKALADAKKASAEKEIALEKAELQKKLDASNAMMAELSRSCAAAEKAQRLAEEDTKAAKEKLYKREQKLATVTQERVEAQGRVDEISAEVKQLSKKLEKARANVKSGEESLRVTREQLERVSNDLKKTSESQQALAVEASTLRAELSKTRGDLEVKINELQASLSESNQRGIAISQLEAAVSAAQSKLEEMRSDYVIATKLTKQSNKELKSSLSAEVRKVAKLERELALAAKRGLASPVPIGLNTPSNSNSNNAGLPQSSGGGGGMSTPIQRGGPQSPAILSPMRQAGGVDALNPFGGQGIATPGGISRTTTASSAVRKPGGGGGAPFRTPPTVPFGTPVNMANRTNTPSSGSSARSASNNNNAPMGGGNFEETVRLLGNRLQDVLAEAEVAREKVKMLESIVRSLSDELADKKKLLRELTSTTTSGVGGGGMSSPAPGGGSGGSSASAMGRVSAEEAAMIEQTIKSAGGDPATLTSLLQKAMGEGARLKRDMRVLGGEVEQAQDKARAANDDARKLEVERDSLLLQIEDLRNQQVLLSNEEGVVEDVEEVDAVIAGGGGASDQSDWPVDGTVPSSSIVSTPTPAGNPFGEGFASPGASLTRSSSSGSGGGGNPF
jgi:peptidoglycan hydrolase CwlO-like protein